MDNNLKSKRGVALLLVLGAIVLFSILGYAALTLSAKDVNISGDIYDIRTQQFSAEGGLNLAITRMSMDPLKTVTELNKFTGDASHAYEWFSFGSSGSFTLINSDTGWTSLGSGANVAACKVRLLGVSSGGTSGISGGAGIVIALESQGKGRDGNIHLVQSAYRLRGLDFKVTGKTNGPTNALLTSGDVGLLNSSADIKGGVYVGGTGLMKMQGPNGSTISKIRTRGSVEILSQLTIDSNSVINGYLQNQNYPITFNRSLIVKGGLNQITKDINVKGSFFLWDTVGLKTATSKGKTTDIQADVTVEGQYFWVRGMHFQMSKTLTVGTSGTSSYAIFDRGAMFKNSSKAVIYGSMYDSLSGFGTGDNVYGSSSMEIKKDLSIIGSGSFTFDQTNLTVNGNASIDAVAGNNNNTSVVNITGNSHFKKGFTSLNMIKFNLYGQAFINAAVQDVSLSNGAMVSFGDKVKFNGTLSSSFGSSSKWKFLSSSSGNWSYAYTSTSGQPALGAIDGAVAFNKRSSDTTFPGDMDGMGSYLIDPVVADRATINPTPLGIGFSAAELDLDPDSKTNENSKFDLTAFPDSTMKRAEWNNLYTKYKDYCTLPDAAPNADDLSCIYKAEKAHLWNGEYLIVHATKSRILDFQGFAGSSVIPTNVKIFWIIDDGCISAPGFNYWYSGDPGSVQIVYSAFLPKGFGWTGTLYGYLFFNSSSGDMPAGKLIGAIEFKGTGGGSLTTQSNNKPLTIDRTSEAAKTIFEDIATNFTPKNSDGKRIIVFNGDSGKDDPEKKTELTVSDGWIQFERIGEYR